MRTLQIGDCPRGLVQAVAERAASTEQSMKPNVGVRVGDPSELLLIASRSKPHSLFHRRFQTRRPWATLRDTIPSGASNSRSRQNLNARFHRGPCR